MQLNLDTMEIIIVIMITKVITLTSSTKFIQNVKQTLNKGFLNLRSLKTVYYHH